MAASQPQRRPEPQRRPGRNKDGPRGPRAVAGYDRQHPTVDAQRDVDRLATFSDAVFAIAMTLLALGLVLPAHAHSLEAALRSLHAKYVSFAISFLVIGVYWMAHHALFAVIVRHDRRLLWINLFLLMSIVLTPFATSVLADYGDQPLGVVVYAGSIATTGLLMTLLAWYALGNGRLAAAGFDPLIGRYMTLRGLSVPLVFLATLPLAWVGSTTVELSWLAVVPIQVFLRRHYETVARSRQTDLPGGL